MHESKSSSKDEMLDSIRFHDASTRGAQFGVKGFYFRPFFSFFVGPLIKKYPRFVRPLLVLARNMKFYLLPKRIEWRYSSDGLATKAIMSFMDDPEFQRSYDRMRIASGAVVDPGLHWRVHQVLWALRHCFTLEGDFVECGTGRGVMMSAGLESLNGWNASGKRIFLFDTFEPFGINQETGDNDPARGVHQWYTPSVNAVVENFSEWKNVNIVKGKIPETLTNAGIEKVAFLHIDLNHSIAECEALRFFWPKIADGGIVLLDDYGTNTTQNEAMNSVAAEFGVRILTTGSAQGIILKPHQRN